MIEESVIQNEQILSIKKICLNCTTRHFSRNVNPQSLLISFVTYLTNSKESGGSKTGLYIPFKLQKKPDPFRETVFSYQTLSLQGDVTL